MLHLTELHDVTPHRIAWKELSPASATAVIHSTFAARICGPVSGTTPPSGTPHAARSPRGWPPPPPPAPPLPPPGPHTPAGGCTTRVTQKWEPPGAPGVASRGTGAVARGLAPRASSTVTSTHTRRMPSAVAVSRAGWDLGVQSASSSSSERW